MLILLLIYFWNVSNILTKKTIVFLRNKTKVSRKENSFPQILGTYGYFAGFTFRVSGVYFIIPELFLIAQPKMTVVKRVDEICTGEKKLFSLTRLAPTSIFRINSLKYHYFSHRLWQIVFIWGSCTPERNRLSI